MIGIYSRCKRESLIYNPKQEAKLCTTCWQFCHRDKDKQREKTRRWQNKNREAYNTYMRNYMRKRLNIKNPRIKPLR